MSKSKNFKTESMYNEYKEHLAIIKGYPSYSEWYDFVCREGQQPVVVAMLVDSFNREVFDKCLDSIRIINYSGESIEFIDDYIKKLQDSI